MQIFPGDSELTMFAEPFLVKDQGLASLEPQTKLEYVERFRMLLASWPGFPPDLGTSLPSHSSITLVICLSSSVLFRKILAVFTAWAITA
ncbi:hypothetical protein M404DRAFT_29096 [Pisolithus tinctorius Marx 270]|uniref:Uncharacterized protein n=1 Tax=Pisolithus tinctorius Marx 270 TaxID=870435 RepID=A0A0C3P057_PISTI|nr:hypothetical protein M404DRAFT_29096 [Pisolithus tinctorius Marx 270]